MASVSGLVEQARGYLPQLARRRSRPAESDARDAATVDAATVDAVSVNPRVRSESVAELIERQVIPRLLLVHRGEGAAAVADAGPEGDVPAISAAETAAFAPLALDTEADALLDHVEAFLRRGVPIESVFVDLLAPAARHLGILWEDDRCDFVDVTMGLWRLQEVLRELSARTPAIHGAVSDASSALFACYPGEQHSFGPKLVEDVFVRAGWATDLLSDCTVSALLDRIAQRSFDLVGLTISCDTNIERLPSLIVAMRNVSRNPRLCVMLGGRVLVADPGLVTRVGADGTAADARSAVEVASRLVAANTCREVFCA